MKSRVTHLKRIAFVLALAAVVGPTSAMASKPEAKQIATYLSGVLPQQTTPAESSRAETKAFADFLRATTAPSYPTPAESGRAEAKAFADFLRATTAPSYPTPAESSRAETKAFANSMRIALAQPQLTANGPAGFDWGDAGVGAAAMLGVVLLLAGLGAGLAISRHNHRRQVMPSA